MSTAPRYRLTVTEANRDLLQSLALAVATFEIVDHDGTERAKLRAKWRLFAAWERLKQG